MAQVAVIGLGRFGFHVARRLHEAGHEVLAVDEVVFPEREGELRLRNRFRVQVLAVRDALTQQVRLNPDATFVVKPSGALLVLGQDEDLAQLKRA